MRMTRREFVPAVLIAIPGAAILGSGLTTARQDTTAGTQGGSPVASPMASPVGSPSASPVASGGAGQTATEVTVEMVDIAFNPTEFTIPANTDVTVTLPNTGVLPHNFNIDAVNVHSGDVPGGDTATVTLNLPPGPYEFYCSVPGHAASGMVGTVTVQ